MRSHAQVCVCLWVDWVYEESDTDGWQGLMNEGIWSRPSCFRGVVWIALHCASKLSCEGDETGSLINHRSAPQGRSRKMSSFPCMRASVQVKCADTVRHTDVLWFVSATSSNDDVLSQQPAFGANKEWQHGMSSSRSETWFVVFYMCGLGGMCQAVGVTGKTRRSP